MTEDSSTSPTPLPEYQEPGDPDSPQERPGRRWNEIWEKLLRLGLGELSLRVGTVVVSIALILLVVWVMGSFYLKGQVTQNEDLAAIAAPLPTATATVPAPSFKVAGTVFDQGIIRLAQIHTILPDKPRYVIDTYEVKSGDTVFGIAEKFGLQPQSILYGNFDTLADDPHRLRPGQTLNILPVDGVLYRWTATDGLNGVSEFFGVKPEDIINWPGNGLSEETIGDFSKPNIEADKLVFVPGGTRDFINWGAPLISRADPAAAKVFGPGYCGSIIDGYIGGGSFVWPTTERWLSGYDWSPQTNHWGIDVAGDLGNAIYATDSGVIVYSGWHERGYGYVVIIDHGNGWQSLYAHLSQIYAGCGLSVTQGAIIGLMGSTGNSSGPHLHFELMNASGTRVNPWNFLQ